MATTTILHIGEDVCQRIPVIESAGFVVLKCEIALPAIRTAFDHGDNFSAILFHSDISAPPVPTVRETRSLSQAPLILFQNPAIICNETDFNLVIPPLTPPALWLKSLKEAVLASIQGREYSHQLRKDCKEAQAWSRSLRESSARNCRYAIDPDSFWRSESSSATDSAHEEDSRPGSARTKTRKP